ncbi:uncharacterized protein LOC122074792 [Macadamia integrifolia]|uniref:uncharacterized protein LOC122074792 n=1 Tax=Macadamia integrifolia TaxID=60698 RepID=UPI001C4E8E34|nr:uncharacterized protein LOC122074792 [Macadamia integrifolia]
MHTVRKWNLPLLRSIFMEDEVKAISQIPLCLSPKDDSWPLCLSSKDDSWVWGLSKSGIFSVRSAYYTSLARLSTGSASFDPFWVVLWNLNIVPKIRFFIWKCCSNSIAVKNVLFIRHLAADTLCPLCSSKDESIVHALFHGHIHSETLSVPGRPWLREVATGLLQPECSVVHTDGAWRASTCKGSRGIIIESSSGDFYVAYCRSGLCYPAMATEAEAIRDGVLLAVSLNLSAVLI